MKLGIIGCGLIGRKRAMAAAKAGFTVSAVGDINIDAARKLAGDVKAQAFGDWRPIIESDVDAVNIAVSHDMLAPVTMAALKAGKHVLVEKPGAHSKAEAEEISVLAKSTGRVVKVGFNHRFHPALLKAREMVEEGEVGSLIYVRGRYGHGGRLGYEKEWRCKKEKSGGGELVDQGSHLIDLSRWFMGDLRLVFAATPTLFWNTEVEDNCFLALEGERKSIAWLHAGWSEWKNIFSLEIAGRDGKLTIDGLGGSYGVERLTFHKMLPGMGPPETTGWEYPFPDDSWVLETRQFLDAVKGLPSRGGDINDAVALWSIIEQAYGARA